jgi:DNA adenine methylase
MLPKSLKTPLRYPGGKSRATKTLFSYLPDDVSEYREPFLGGGSMAIEFTRRYPDIPVWVNDIDPLVAKFWQVLQGDPYQLITQLLETKKSSNIRADFDYCKTLSQDISDLDDLTVAWCFFILNKCGFSGLTASGFSQQASEQNFSVNNIHNLEHFAEHIQHWRITNDDYGVMLEGDGFIYLDPPYAKVGKDGNSFLYGRGGKTHRDFDHDRFFEEVGTVSASCMLSYDNNPHLCSLYSDWRQETFNLTYTMRSDKAYRKNEKGRKELLLMNYEETP